MSDAEPSTPSNIDRDFDPQLWPLWVVEGKIDLPVRLPSSPTGSEVRGGSGILNRALSGNSA